MRCILHRRNFFASLPYQAKIIHNCYLAYTITIWLIYSVWPAKYRFIPLKNNFG